jgi:hypothetical protein
MQAQTNRRRFLQTLAAGAVALDLRKAEFVDDPQANRMRSRAMRAPFAI